MSHPGFPDTAGQRRFPSRAPGAADADPANAAELDNRRRTLKAFAMTVFGLAAGCSGCGGSAAGDAVANAAPPSPSPSSGSPGPLALPAPAANAAPPGPAGAYRCTQTYLFATIARAAEPARIAGTADLSLDVVGPHRDYVDFYSGWKWRNAGGDWIDANRAPMGGTPWASVLANAAKGSNAAADYTADVTAALKFVQSSGRWNAWIVRWAPGSTAPRVIAGRFFEARASRPAIDVVYVDGSQSTLLCRVSAFIGAGMNAPAQALPQLGLPIALEFDLPTQPVKTATLRFRVTQHWDGANPGIQFFLADPPVNTDAVSGGLASNYPLDAGLAGDPAIIGVHRYLDGSALSDFVHPRTMNPEPTWAWSPDVLGTGAADATKLPYAGLGKFVPVSNYDWTLVSSTHTGESFAPLTPGIGALRVKMPKMTGIADGVEVGQYGTAAANAFINMPANVIGSLARIFVRYYLFIGTTADTGVPYRTDIAKKYQVTKLGVPTWTDMEGKLSVISPAHKTALGGNSGTSGGGHGWVLRPGFRDTWEDNNSPAAGGLQMSHQWWDYQNNPPGYNYATRGERDFVAWGQRGGLGGVLYAARWYCIEEEIKLNSVDAVNAIDGRNWAPDGECRVWVDGRLAYEATGLVFRSLPALQQPTGYVPAIRQLGIKHLWFNWFHGGLTQNSVDRVIYVSGLAWGTARIGPMRL